jgi:hypothetical protein
VSEPEFTALLRQTGWNITSEPQRIGNTGNNRAYRVTADGREALVKHYFRHPSDPRDRFAAERGFYEFLWQSGVRCIPEPMAWAPQLRLGLFEFIPGERPSEATPELVGQAASFFRAMNAHRNSNAGLVLPDASEACFSIRAHLSCVERRIARLLQLPDGRGVEGEAAILIRKQLTPAWRRIERLVLDRTPAEALEREILRPESCVSPSDFGFHNALLTLNGEVRFFDFEYAGWDDPAKTVCDFLHQPAVPVNQRLRQEFCSGFAEFDHPDFRLRVETLLPVYAVKWCCIMLNEFLPHEQDRRAFSNPADDTAIRRRTQVEKVKEALARLPDI